MSISIIVAIAENNAIGFENKLLYWLPNDLKRFKALTTGHTIIMGRKTFESLPKGALPNRRNLVLSHQDIEFPGAERFPSLEAALAAITELEDKMLENVKQRRLKKMAINPMLAKLKELEIEIKTLAGMRI